MIAYMIEIMEHDSWSGPESGGWKVCLTKEDCLVFKNEINSKNNQKNVPDFYMTVDGQPKEIELSDEQYKVLVEHDGRINLELLKKLSLTKAHMLHDKIVKDSTNAFSVVEKVLRSHDLEKVQSSNYQDKLAREIVNILVTQNFMK